MKSRLIVRGRIEKDRTKEECWRGLRVWKKFGILNFGHCDLPFDLAQGGGGGELVEPFVIWNLFFGNF